MRRVTNTPPSVFLTSVQTDHSAERAWLQEDRLCDRWCTLRDCGGLSVPNSPLSCALLQESDFVGPPSPELPYWLSLMLHQATGVSKDRITVINQTICVNWDDSCPRLIVQIKILTFPKGKARFRIKAQDYQTPPSIYPLSSLTHPLVFPAQRGTCSWRTARHAENVLFPFVSHRSYALMPTAREVQVPLSLGVRYGKSLTIAQTRICNCKWHDRRLCPSVGKHKYQKKLRG